MSEERKEAGSEDHFSRVGESGRIDEERPNSVPRHDLSSENSEPSEFPFEDFEKYSPPTRRGRLKDDDIESKVGNYLLTFGFAGAGKTTFQSFLAHYITNIGDLDTNPVLNPEETSMGWEALATYNEWMRMWQKGEFPPSNPVDEGDIRELTFEVVPREGRQIPLEFSFLEASGELMSEVMVERSEDPHLVETLARYFGNPNINVCLCFLVDPGHGGENDLLFQNLLSFLKVNFPGLTNRISLAVLVSKPKTALKQLKLQEPGFRHHAELRGDVIEDYLEVFYPRLFKLVESWPEQDKVGVLTLHLGEVQETASGAFLVKSDFRDIEKIFEWLYQQFTGHILGPTWFQRIWHWVRT